MSRVNFSIQRRLTRWGHKETRSFDTFWEIECFFSPAYYRARVNVCMSPMANISSNYQLHQRSIGDKWNKTTNKSIDLICHMSDMVDAVQLSLLNPKNEKLEEQGYGD